MNHPLQCSCGRLKGTVALTGMTNRCICYCKDCQAFAHFLGRHEEILDAQGGTDIVQTVPARVHFTAGIDYLACLRLTDKGMLRWYAKCCQTPIGNTLESHRFAFIGLIHSCLESGQQSLDQSFGPVQSRVNTQGARGASLKPHGQLATVVRVGAMMLRARIDGSYQQTPFFVADVGTPVVIPKILGTQEHDQLMKSVGA